MMVTLTGASEGGVKTVQQYKGGAQPETDCSIPRQLQHTKHPLHIIQHYVSSWISYSFLAVGCVPHLVPQRPHLRQAKITVWKLPPPPETYLRCTFVQLHLYIQTLCHLLGRELQVKHPKW